MHPLHQCARNSRFRLKSLYAALFVSVTILLAPAIRAQTYDFSAATELLSDNLAQYSGGVFVQVFQDDTEVFSFQSGNVTADTQLPIASATKWLSSAIVLRLVERGLFQLDDPIGDYLPIFNLHGKGNVTIRQCFSMTSGLYETDIDYETAPLITLTQSVNQIAINVPIVFTPGTQLAYDGDGMQVVGRICEVVTGKDWRTLVNEELVQPLGMTSTDYQLWPVNPGIAGGGRSTAASYQKFLRMILRNGLADDGSLYLTSRTVKEWFSNQTKGLPEYNSVWPPFAYPYGQRPDYGHGSWVLAQNPATQLVEEIASPGAFGTFPWVDVKRRLRGIITTYAPAGFSATVINDLRVLDALRAAVDVVGVPPQPGKFTQEPMNGFFQLRWPLGTLETSDDFSTWAQLPWARSPFNESPTKLGVPRLFYRVRLPEK
jgi:CubicO group peptidase (beta-lactamase class C family)